MAVQVRGNIRAEKARRSLHEFVRQAWQIVEPANDFVDGWHIKAICLHLEAVSRGEIRNLLINMPPRHMKSLIAAVFFPAWVWIDQPHKRFLFASYSLSLSVRDGRKCRQIIESEWYQSHWGDKFRILSDQNAKIRFENNHMGQRLCCSVGSAATGEGGDIIVVDDPHNVKEAESDIVREETLVWWKETMSSRLNDQKKGSRIVIGQRVHQRDLSGYILEKNRGYDYLCLPAEYEGDNTVTSIGWSDPREELGELLWEERMGVDELASQRIELGLYAYAAQYQQRPSPREGGILKPSWFGLVDKLPEYAKYVRFWDLASTKKIVSNNPDWSVGSLVCKPDAGPYILTNVRRTRNIPTEVERFVLQTAELDTDKVLICMEQEPGASGVALVGHFRTLLKGYRFKAVVANVNKDVRIKLLASYAEGGAVSLKRADWNFDFLAECETYPMGSFDDQLDSVSGAINELRKMGGKLDMMMRTPSRWAAMTDNQGSADPYEIDDKRAVARERRLSSWIVR